ncbi:MAG TPA: PAS domain S-box protein, partial [Thermoplasmatales archaeon]|nr:PAS domain S-box protein [Thermoplasmatales archaeon]
WQRIRAEKIRERGVEHDIETRMIRKNGKTIDVGVSINVLKDAEGKIIGSIGIVRDISEEKRLKSQLTAIMEYSDESIYLVDRDTRYIIVNNALLNRLKLPRDEVIGKKFSEIHDEEETRVFVEKINEVFTTGKSTREEYRNSNLDRWFLRTYSPVKEGLTNEIIAVAVISNDITDLKNAELQLRESEEKYRTIFENSPVAIMLTDAEERLVSWNTHTEKLLGMSSEELNLRPISSLYPSEEWERIRSERIREKGVRYNFETKMIHKNGRYIDINLSLNVLKNQKGEIKGAIGIAEDITEKKQMERDIKLKEKSLDSSVNGIIFVDSQGYISYANLSFLEMWRYSSQKEVLGKPAVELWQYKREFLDIFYTAMEKGVLVSEFNAQRKNGEIFPVKLYASVVKDDNNNFSHLMLSFVDIGEQKRGEQKRIEYELKESLQKTKAIFENMPFGVVIIGRDKIVRDANKTALDILGREREEVVTHICHQIICPNGEGRCPILDLGKNSDKSEIVIIGRDGREISLLKTVKPINVDGEEMILETLIDLTEL